MNKFHLFIFLTLLVFSSSCEEDEATFTLNQNESYFETIKSLGFLTDGIVESECCFIVEGDIVLQKKQLMRHVDKLKPDQKQYRTTDINGAELITISAATNLPQIWVTGLQRAVDSYNELGEGITFAYVGPQSDISDIHVVYQSIPNSSGTIAQAEWPIDNGQNTNSPGRQITVNSTFNPFRCQVSATTVGMAHYNMAHEIGHTIGFRHTNFQCRVFGGSVVSEGQSTDGAVHIPGTATSTPTGNWTSPCADHDANSVFNGGTACFSWAGFSNDDVTSIGSLFQKQYCDDSPIPGLVADPSHNGGAEMNYISPLTWDQSSISSSHVRIDLYFGENSRYQFVNNLAGTTGYFAIDYDNNGFAFPTEIVPNTGSYDLNVPYVAHYWDNIGGGIINSIEADFGGAPYRVRVSDNDNPCIHGYSPGFWITD